MISLTVLTYRGAGQIHFTGNPVDGFLVEMIPTTTLAIVSTQITPGASGLNPVGYQVVNLHAV